jgi:predicted aspartyl protease
VQTNQGGFVETSHIVAIGLIILSAGAPGRATGADRTRAADVRFTSSQHGEIVIPVFIGGAGPYRFLLDTGSSHTVISQSLATTLKAVPVAKAPVATSVGSILALVVRLEDVAVGSAKVQSLLATSLPPSAAGVLGDGISGVLGQDFLSQFNYTLDYRTSRLSWDEADQIAKGVRLALEPSRGRFLVHLPQDERCRCPVRLIPDSGANGVVLFAGTEADRLPVSSSVTSIDVSTLVGDRSARGVIVKALLVGAATLWDLPAARVVLPEGTTEDGDGLLPMSLFARVSFRYRGGYMVVQPR